MRSQWHCVKVVIHQEDADQGT
jgi:osmotically inducible protein OsmC